MRRSPHLMSSLALAAALAAGSAQAIVASDGTGNWLGAGLPALDGVGKLTIVNPGGSFLCSGSLLAGGQYVLTAAHCLTNDTTGALNAAAVTVEFKPGTAAAVTTVGASYSVAPGWAGLDSLGNGSDLAIVRLATPVTTIAGYGLSTTNDIGKTFLMAGYGRIGDGTAGATAGTSGTLHYGYNVFDTTDLALTTALRNAGYGGAVGPAYTKYGDTYVFDFDNGSANQNAIKRLYDLTAVSGASNLGVSLEAMFAQGDSGGGDFVLDGSGNWVLSAVHSLDWNLCSNSTSGTLANCVVGPSGSTASFGSLGESTSVFSQSAWIAQVTGVPEPSSYVLMAAGLVCCGWLARRRGTI